MPGDDNGVARSAGLSVKPSSLGRLVGMSEINVILGYALLHALRAD